jgi:hypothetical protein
MVTGCLSDLRHLVALRKQQNAQGGMLQLHGDGCLGLGVVC